MTFFFLEKAKILAENFCNTDREYLKSYGIFTLSHNFCTIFGIYAGKKLEGTLACSADDIRHHRRLHTINIGKFCMMCQINVVGVQYYKILCQLGTNTK